MRDKYFGSHEFSIATRSSKHHPIAISGWFLLRSLLCSQHSASGMALGVGRSGSPWPASGLVLALAAPRLLAPFNWVWTKFGLLLHRIISPIFLTILFYGCIAPIGFLMRLSGKDPLRLKYEPDAESYWISARRRVPPRKPSRTSSETMMVHSSSEFWAFLRERKKYWLLPILIMMVLFGGLIVLTKGSAVAPFIYTLF